MGYRGIGGTLGKEKGTDVVIAVIGGLRPVAI